MICERCPSLWASRTRIVETDLPDFGRPCRILAIGEAPGTDEDAQGRGFVGRAGRGLHNLLKQHGLRRGYDYGCANIVRCRPPDNRKPSAEERANCLPHLAETILMAKPDALLLVGNTAAQTFLGGGSFGAILRHRRPIRPSGTGAGSLRWRAARNHRHPHAPHQSAGLEPQSRKRRVLERGWPGAD
ncbi:uracil-DNA glycosylase [Acidithiobacillus sulfuriphilus]|uniref:Uracil-DNA glycosylase n=1 Tax=Acidithiobacillus sulfuriphilus TaxID=1867749 RepID=A0ACD5HS14_9PROT|nr:uracil-DNA glycosylase [Acidithiobacillus sulfuriphilus]